MDINISGVIINNEVNLVSSDLMAEFDKRYNDMLLFRSNKISTAQLMTAYQGEKHRFSIFWNLISSSTFIIAELHPRNDILEKLSQDTKILSFRFSDEKGIFIIMLFDQGVLKRRKMWCNPSFGLYDHFMKYYKEEGAPLSGECVDDGRRSVLNVLESECNLLIEDLPAKMRFNRLTYKPDKEKMRGSLKEDEE